MGKTKPKAPARAGSVLDFFATLDPDGAAEALARASAAAGEAVLGFVERVSLFSGNAAFYVDAYHRIRVPEYRAADGKIERTGVTIDTPVTEYANTRLANFAGHPTEVRLGLKDVLLFQLPALLKGKLEVGTAGRAVTIRKDGRVLLSVGFGAVNASFNGKGTPQMLAKTIELLQLWIVVVRDIHGRDRYRTRVGGFKLGKRFIERRSHEYDVEDLQTMVDGYLGVDCNGFTGNYLKAKFPALTVTAETEEEAYVTKEAFNRKTVADIKVDDTAVFNDGSYHHVAMVSSVLGLAPDLAQIILSEARTARRRQGGPQSNIWHVRPRLVARGKPGAGTPIEGQFVIDGRDDIFVKFASPDRFKAGA